MDKENLWEELKFEASSLHAGIELLGSGNKDAEILFIGDDVTLYEDEQLKVRAGSAGEFLIKLCDITELSPDSYYITTLSKERAKFRELQQREKEILKECLDMQIALIAPRIVVALGQDAAEALLERDVKMSEERGRLFQWKGNIKMLISHDAGFAMRSRADAGKKSKAALEFWNDLKILRD